MPGLLTNFTYRLGPNRGHNWSPSGRWSLCSIPWTACSLRPPILKTGYLPLSTKTAQMAAIFCSCLCEKRKLFFFPTSVFWSPTFVKSVLRQDKSIVSLNFEQATSLNFDEKGSCPLTRSSCWFPTAINLFQPFILCGRRVWIGEASVVLKNLKIFEDRY